MRGLIEQAAEFLGNALARVRVLPAPLHERQEPRNLLGVLLGRADKAEHGIDADDEGGEDSRGG